MPPAGVSTSQKPGSASYDTYYVANRGAERPAGDRCAVTFWNLTGQGLALTVDGRSYTLSRGESMRLRLKRDFAWGVAGREAQRQQIPPEESGLEVVIRG
jgi:hypothetical protein